MTAQEIVNILTSEERESLYKAVHSFGWSKEMLSGKGKWVDMGLVERCRTKKTRALRLFLTPLAYKVVDLMSCLDTKNLLHTIKSSDCPHVKTLAVDFTLMNVEACAARGIDLDRSGEIKRAIKLVADVKEEWAYFDAYQMVQNAIHAAELRNPPRYQ